MRPAYREAFAEVFGTFIIVLFGDGSVAQVLLSTSNATQTIAPGMDYGWLRELTISWE